MSLAQKIDTLPTSKFDVVSLSAAPGLPKAITPTPIDFRQLTRRLPDRAAVTSLSALAAQASAGAVRAPDQPAAPDARPAIVAREEAGAPGTAHSAAALDLLTEVSSALSTLMDRCQGLESTLEATQEQAKADLEVANGEALKFLHRSEMLAQMVAQLEETVASLQQRLANADEHFATISAVAEKKQQEAAAAECLSALFQQRVLTSFGEGSVGHSILESVRRRTQAHP